MDHIQNLKRKAGKIMSHLFKKQNESVLYKWCDYVHYVKKALFIKMSFWHAPS